MLKDQDQREWVVNIRLDYFLDLTSTWEAEYVPALVLHLMTAESNTLQRVRHIERNMAVLNARTV